MPFKSFQQDAAKIDEAEGIVTFYASAFGNMDSDGDIIEPGAFAETIRERGPQGSNRIKYLWAHEAWSMPIGQPISIREDDRGLLVEAKLAPTDRGREALALYKIGAITEHSIGLDILDRDEEDSRIIKKARLWDVSAVNWGANPLTPTVSVKGKARSVKDRAVLGLRKILDAGVSERNVDDLVIAANVLLKTLDPVAPEAPTEDALLDQFLRILTPDPVEPTEEELLSDLLHALGA